MNVNPASAALQDMQRMSVEANGASASMLPVAEGEGGRDFLSLLNDMIGQVSQAQNTGGEQSRRFELGDPDVDLAQVMVAQQKSRLAFQTTLQVRNKLVDAYRDVMNMPV